MNGCNSAQLLMRIQRRGHHWYSDFLFLISIFEHYSKISTRSTLRVSSSWLDNGSDSLGNINYHGICYL